MQHLIVGDGVAGMTAAAAIRMNRPGDRIVVLSADPQPYYYRASLTNYLMGDLSDEELWALPADAWDGIRIERVSGEAVALDAATRRVALRDGAPLPYDRLLVASGARARRLSPDVPGADLDGIHVLRTLFDTRRIIEALPATRRAVVLGGGILGLEACQGLRARNVDVTLVHRGAWLLERVVDRRAGELIRLRMERAGVDVRLESGITACGGARGRLRSVTLKDGSELECSLLVTAIGNLPNTEWLAGSGADLERGYVATDDTLKARGVEDVWAAGDVAFVEQPAMPFRNPVGLWQPARRQGRVAGLGMGAADSARRARYRPGAIYNATRAWDLDLGTLGAHVDGDGETVVFEGRVANRPVYKRALVRDGHLVGVLLLGDRREGQALRRLMNLRGAATDVAAIRDRLFDPRFDLFAWIAAQRRQPGVAKWNHTVLLPRGMVPPSRAAAGRPTTQLAISLAPRETRDLLAGRLPDLVLRLPDREFRCPGRRAVIGRSADSDLRVPGAAAGDERVVLAREGAAWMASSTAPARPAARINGRPLVRPQALRDLDVLEVGGLRAVVSLPPPRARTAEERAPRSWLLGRERYPLSKPVVMLGATSDNHVVLEGEGISAFHAQVLARGAHHYVVDAGSRSGTFVNDERVAAPRRLERGDVVRIGDVRLVYEHAPASAAPETKSRAKPAKGPPVYLEALDGPLAGRVLALPQGGRIGRAAEADLVLDDPLCSRVHARVAKDRGGFVIQDLGSVNGVFVDGARLAAGSAQPLRDASEIVLGRGRFRFHVERPVARRVAPPAEVPVRSAPTLLAAAYEARLKADWHLEVAQPGMAPRVVALDKDELVVGRSRKCDLMIDEQQASREHLKFARAGPFVTVEDLGSAYGALLNEAPLPPRQPRPLAPGDTVEVAGVRLSLREGEAPGSAIGLELLTKMAGLDVPARRLEGPGPFVIGRDPACDFPVGVRLVSRRHAEIRREGTGFRLFDRKSRFGTSVGGVAVPDEGTMLGDGDVVSMKGVDIAFSVAAPEPQPSADLPVAAGFAVDWSRAGDPLERDLQRVVETELDACIGCHDCMRACPLPDAPAVTVGALNHFALGLAEPGEVALRFVEQCTQCQACVPVCPADIQRSRMVLWNKLKRPPDPGRRLTVQVGDRREESAWTLGELIDRLREHALLDGLSAAERLDLFGRARVRRLADGEELVTEGQYPDALWLVLEGKVELGMAVGDRPFARMTVLSGGQTVGEAALLSDQPSDVTARAQGGATAVGVAKYPLQALAKLNDRFRADLDRLHVARSVEYFVKRHERLRDLPDEVLVALMGSLEAERYDAGRTVLDRARSGDVFGLVRRGFVRELRAVGGRAVVANYLKEGDGFGGMDSGRRGELDRFESATQCEVLTLTRARLAALEARCPGLETRLFAPSPGVAAPRGHTAQFAAADAAGVLQGAQVMVIDARRCVDCDNCVKACERRHGHTRLDRSNCGQQVGPFQIPGSCFHCKDPLCLLCAVDGIVREPDGEIRIKTQNCIGCGACAERCPYDNIRMVPREPPPRARRVLPDFLLRLFGWLEDASDLPDYEATAIKCDLCAGYGNGPACVRSCPTGAAMRVEDPAAFFATALKERGR